MSKKTQDIKRRNQIIGGAERAKAPPISAVRKSLATLRRSISERQRAGFYLVTEQNKLREQLYAPVLDLLKSDPRSTKAKKALAKSYGKLRADIIEKVRTRSDSGLDTTDISTGDESQFVVVAPSYAPYTAAWQHNAYANSDAMGKLDTSFIVPQAGGNSWAWAGVGFPLVPDQDRTYRIQPFLIGQYFFDVGGMLGVSAHIEGCCQIHVHRFDEDWQDTQEMTDYNYSIFSHTTETNFRCPNSVFFHDETTYVPLRGDSNYLIWASLEMSGNSSFWSFAGGTFWGECVRILVNDPFA